MTGPPPRSVHEVVVDRVEDGRRARRGDVLAVEEPLEIRILHGSKARRTQHNLGLTMRTPGEDEELVAGLLLSEGVVRERADLVRFRHGKDRDGMPDANVLVAELDPSTPYDAAAHERLSLRSSACGVCGRASLDVLALRGPPAFRPGTPTWPDAVLRALPAGLREKQRVFAATGGLHAAALFDPGGKILAIREDVGRHNAVDKLLGAEWLTGRIPRTDSGMLVSGRASFEILQKALFGGVPLVASIGAPSSLAVDLAGRFGQTLLGFLRADGYNVYAGPGRIRTGD